VEIRPILGRADTPIVHFAHPVFWFGYIPIVAAGPRRIAAAAKTSLWLGRVPQAAVRALLDQQPKWWREITRLSILYGDVAQNVAADLLIRDSERRCAAVLLRLGGRRFPGPDDNQSIAVPITQDELAGAANLSRNSIGTMLQRLKERQLVEPGYRSMTICTPNALRAFVNQG
jgi:CRP/FNR family cyclic AMP-dependent transcriptional regulator